MKKDLTCKLKLMLKNADFDFSGFIQTIVNLSYNIAQDANVGI